MASSSSPPPPTRAQSKYFPIKPTPMLPKGTFAGKVAMITGGGTGMSHISPRLFLKASPHKGLGKGMALMLSSLGASVAIIGRWEVIRSVSVFGLWNLDFCSRRSNVLQQTADELFKSTGNKVLPLSCDVRDPEAVRATVDTIEAQIGLPTVIINNVAGNFDRKSFIKCLEDYYRHCAERLGQRHSGNGKAPYQG